MSVFWISAQDISRITFALVRDGVFVFETTMEVPPEQYLAALDATLEEQGIGAIDAVGIVAGPGSFTSTRMSVTMANGFAFSRSIPVISVENPSHLPLKDVVRPLAPTDTADRFAIPVYDRPAHITTPATQA